MKRLARLRRQLLLAMGLPVVGCSGGGARTPPAEASALQKLAESYDEREDGTVRTAFGDLEPADCKPDQLYEKACGRAQTQCGPTGDSLAEVATAELHVTGERTPDSPDVSPGALRDFRLHESATRGYREESGDASACCYASCTSLEVAFSAPELEHPYYYGSKRCLPRPPGGTEKPAEGNAACPAAVALGKGGELAPYSDDGSGDEQCCYQTPTRRPRVIRGRAARIEGQIAMAGARPDAVWPGGEAGWRPRVTDLTDSVRAELAQRWLDDARMEHASIAAFSRLSLELLALGAPPALVADTHAAALDEVLHAELAFAIASRYAGTSLGPAPFEGATRMGATGDLAALLEETFIDGCIGETVAASEAEHAARQATDPAIAAVLERVAADESRHAALAWAILAWGLRSADSTLTRRLSSALAGYLDGQPDGRDGRAGDCEASCHTCQHGVLCTRAAAAVRWRTIAEIVRPCLGDLLASLDKPL